MQGSHRRIRSRAAVTIIAAALLSSSLAGCTTPQALEVPKPVPRGEPINSLALEQCVRENGRKGCVGEDM
jgi:outer membrane protein assembly factor BamE (lipoprotein component of BamABCDE complex)